MLCANAIADVFKENEFQKKKKRIKMSILSYLVVNNKKGKQLVNILLLNEVDVGSARIINVKR